MSYNCIIRILANRLFYIFWRTKGGLYPRNPNDDREMNSLRIAVDVLNGGNEFNSKEMKMAINFFKSHLDYYKTKHVNKHRDYKLSLEVSINILNEKLEEILEA